MNAPDPVPQKTSISYTPNNSTIATGVAGALASLIIFTLSLKGITFPAGQEAALTTVIAFIGSYLPKSGRT